MSQSNVWFQSGMKDSIVVVGYPAVDEIYYVTFNGEVHPMRMEDNRLYRKSFSGTLAGTATAVAPTYNLSTQLEFLSSDLVTMPGSNFRRQPGPYPGDLTSFEYDLSRRQPQHFLHSNTGIGTLVCISGEPPHNYDHRLRVFIIETNASLESGRLPSIEISRAVATAGVPHIKTPLGSVDPNKASWTHLDLANYEFVETATEVTYRRKG